MPRELAAVTQAESLAASFKAVPVHACGCSSGPEPIDVMVLAGLLVLRTLSERMLTGRR